jgi:hypothetical protein
MTNEEILQLARERARQYGKPMPATRADVERLTGLMYTGPDPRAIGKIIYTVPVVRIK